MRTFLVAMAAVVAVGVMSSCGMDSTDESGVVTEPSVATSSSFTSTTSTTQTSATPSTSTSEARALEPAVAPVFVRCQLADGTALMSDGSTTYMDSCHESAGGPLLLEDGTSIYDHLPQADPENVPFADGGNCPAYKCGYGHDENGNPNPSSGEIQTKHGCDEGYIADSNLCTAVNEKYDW